MRKRVNELCQGDIFWFSGVWRVATGKDDKYIYYNRAFKKDHGDTLMANSLMIVEVNNDLKENDFSYYQSGRKKPPNDGTQ